MLLLARRPTLAEIRRRKSGCVFVQKEPSLSFWRWGTCVCVCKKKKEGTPKLTRFSLPHPSELLSHRRQLLCFSHPDMTGRSPAADVNPNFAITGGEHLFFPGWMSQLCPIPYVSSPIVWMASQYIGGDVEIFLSLLSVAHGGVAVLL